MTISRIRPPRPIPMYMSTLLPGRLMSSFVFPARPRSNRRGGRVGVRSGP
jgi:hypothetical protein